MLTAGLRESFWVVGFIRALTAVAQPHFCISATFGYWRAGVIFEGVLAVLDWTCGVFLVSPSLSAPLCAVSIVPEPSLLL